MAIVDIFIFCVSVAVYYENWFIRTEKKRLIANIIFAYDMCRFIFYTNKKKYDRHPITIQPLGYSFGMRKRNHRDIIFAYYFLAKSEVQMFSFQIMDWGNECNFYNFNFSGIFIYGIMVVDYHSKEIILVIKALYLSRYAVEKVDAACLLKL